MKTKKEALKAVERIAQHELLSQQELLTCYRKHLPADATPINSRFKGLMICLGTGLCILGLMAWYFGNYQYFNLHSQLFILFIGALLGQTFGFYYQKKMLTFPIELAFYSLALCCFILLGALVAVELMAQPFYLARTQMILSGSLLGLYLAFDWRLNRSFFTCCVIFLGTWFITSLVFWFNGNQEFIAILNLNCYLLAGFGFAYMILSCFFENTRRQNLSGFLYHLGLIGLLLGPLLLGGGFLDRNPFWDIIYPFLIVISFLYHANQRRKLGILITALFGVVYIQIMTVTYFDHSLSWPIILITGGLSIVSLSCLSFRVYKK